MRSLLNSYLRAKKDAWASSTVRSVRSRLGVILDQFPGSLGYYPTPQALWEHFKANLAPYSRRTTWVTYEKFFDWLKENVDEYKGTGCNPYTKFREENRKAFSIARIYSRNVPRTTLVDAYSRINNINCSKVRRYAEVLLETGCRFSELQTLQDGYVVGKGGKTRRVFYDGSPPPRVEHGRFWRELKKVGLRPHDLRKIFLTECVNQGASTFELVEIAGWSSIQPALSYIAGRNAEEVVKRVTRSKVSKVIPKVRGQVK